MNRRITKDKVTNLIKYLRQEIPEIIIRTTFIVGFPGEDDKSSMNYMILLKKLSLIN